MGETDLRQPRPVHAEPMPPSVAAIESPSLAPHLTPDGIFPTVAPAAVLALQRSAGNAAVQRMLVASGRLLRQDAGTADAGAPAADAGTRTADAGTQTADAGTQAGDAGTAAPAAIVGTPMPGPRDGLVILAELDRIHTRMSNAGYPSRIGSGLRTIDEQIRTYAKGRTFQQFQTAITAAVTAGSVTQAKATEWIAYYNPAAGNHPMPPGEPGPVTWTFASRHLTGEAADIVHATLGWGAGAPFWAALAAAASAEGLQIGPPATDVAHVQRP
jgi:hypothetical protein